MFYSYILIYNNQSVDDPLNMNYYKIDRILAEEEKISVKFEKDIENFGFYAGPLQSNVKADTKVDMPLFLVKFLIQNEHCFLVDHPLTKKSSTLLRNDLEANSSIVDLKNRHFYFVNRNIGEKDFLNRIFFERIGTHIILITKEDFNEDDMSKLSYEEKRIIADSRKKFLEFEEFYFNTNG